MISKFDDAEYHAGLFAATERPETIEPRIRKAIEAGEDQTSKLMSFLFGLIEGLVRNSRGK